MYRTVLRLQSAALMQTSKLDISTYSLHFSRSSIMEAWRSSGTRPGRFCGASETETMRDLHLMPPADDVSSSDDILRLFSLLLLCLNAPHPDDNFRNRGTAWRIEELISLIDAFNRSFWFVHLLCRLQYHGYVRTIHRSFRYGLMPLLRTIKLCYQLI